MVRRQPSRVNGFAAIVADKAGLAQRGLKKADTVRAVQEAKERMVELKLEWHQQLGATTKDAVLHKYRTDEDTERTLAQKHNLRVVSKPRDDPQSKFTKQPAIVDKAKLALSIIILFLMLVAVITTIAICKWKMTKGLGATVTAAAAAAPTTSSFTSTSITSSAVCTSVASRAISSAAAASA